MYPEDAAAIYNQLKEISKQLARIADALEPASAQATDSPFDSAQAPRCLNCHTMLPAGGKFCDPGCYDEYKAIGLAYDAMDTELQRASDWDAELFESGEDDGWHDCTDQGRRLGGEDGGCLDCPNSEKCRDEIPF